MIAETPAPLAIIIPAYRIQYLAEALGSLAGQTDQNFRVYIGDDASPDPLHEVVAQFSPRLHLHYRRFPENVGKNNLVAHWHRCISLSKDEPWLWLFSDDDILEPDCVARFHAATRHTGRRDVDLYRFQMDFIDEKSARFWRPADHPEFETVDDVLRGFLTNRRRAWRAQDHVFSRRAFERWGGFVEFPNAIYSDHATWLRFASDAGVRTVPGPRVLWRSHPRGTSTGLRSIHRQNWLSSAQLYLNWLNTFAREQGPATARLFVASGREFYFQELASFRPMLTAAERRAAIGCARSLFGGTWLGACLHLHATLLSYRLTHSRFTEPMRAGRMQRLLAGNRPQ